MHRTLIIVLFLWLTDRGLAQTPSPTPNISAMVAKLKAAKTANRPFIIYLTDGTQLPVPNNTYLALNPSGTFTNFVVFSDADTTHMIPVNQVVKLTLGAVYPFDQ